MLAHVAEWQAKLVVRHILQRRQVQALTASSSSSSSPSASPSSPSSPSSSPSCSGVAEQAQLFPAAIFTSPEAACVGPSEDRLKASGVAYECRKAFHRANGKALAMGETDGMLKLFSEPEAGRILGCHAFGAHAADMVQEVSALMCLGATVAQLRNIVHIHPTVGEILLAAAESNA